MNKLYEEIREIPTEISQVRIGEKPDGQNYPARLDYFKVIDLFGDKIDDIYDLYDDEKPKILHVQLGYDSPKDNLALTLGCYRGGGSLVSCVSTDGVNAFRLWKDGLEKNSPAAFEKAKNLYGVDEYGNLNSKIPCKYRDCDVFKQGKCKRVGILSLLILDPTTLQPVGDTIEGVCKFRTTGKTNINCLFNNMEMFEYLTGGVLAGIPFTLRYNKRKSSTGRIVPQLILGFKGTPEVLDKYASDIKEGKPRFVLPPRSEKRRDSLEDLADPTDDEVIAVVNDFFPEEAGSAAGKEETFKASNRQYTKPVAEEDDMDAEMDAAPAPNPTPPKEKKGKKKKEAPKEEPPKEDPPKEDPPKEDTPKEDPPKEDPPKEEPPEEEDFKLAKNMKVCFLDGNGDYFEGKIDQKVMAGSKLLAVKCDDHVIKVPIRVIKPLGYITPPTEDEVEEVDEVENEVTETAVTETAAVEETTDAPTEDADEVGEEPDYLQDVPLDDLEFSF